VKTLYIITILATVHQAATSQDLPLFQQQDVLNVRVTGSVKSIKKNTNDSTFITSSLQYAAGEDKWITVPLKARVRGNFRLRNCFFPPLKLKFEKKDVAATIFEGNKALKLVLPCKTTADNNGLIRREYLCYQFYELLSPFYFKTRLARLSLTEVSRSKPRTYDLLVFFVEDNALVAKRAGGDVVQNKSISPAAFDEKQSVRNDFFQYMIGNADWSSVHQHNSNTLYVKPKFIPLSYDFDMAGFVNAGYARDSPPTLGTGDVRERVYRGFCKSKSMMEEVRAEYLEKQESVRALIDAQAASFSGYELDDMHHYLDQFFDILKSDNRFKEAMVDMCRTK
jgi:hypothetical protein